MNEAGHLEVDLCPGSGSSPLLIHADVSDRLSNCTRRSPITHSGLQPLSLTFTETGRWITCQPRLTICVLFTFAELRFVSVHMLRGLTAAGRSVTHKMCMLRELVCVCDSCLALSQWSWQTKVRFSFCCWILFCFVYLRYMSNQALLLQWTPARVWIRALWLRRSHMKTTTSRPTKGLSHLYFLFLIFIQLYLRQVKYSS